MVFSTFVSTLAVFWGVLGHPQIHSNRCKCCRFHKKRFMGASEFCGRPTRSQVPSWSFPEIEKRCIRSSPLVSLLSVCSFSGLFCRDVEMLMLLLRLLFPFSFHSFSPSPASSASPPSLLSLLDDSLTPSSFLSSEPLSSTVARFNAVLLQSYLGLADCADRLHYRSSSNILSSFCNVQLRTNTIASRIPAARPEGSPFAARGILSF